MEARQIIEKSLHLGQGFKVMTEFEGWKIGFLRYSDRFSKFDRLERHLLTDEVFVLLDGEAVLYTDKEEIKMEKNFIYNLPKAEWHHIVVSKDAYVMVVENANTGDDNTEIKFI